MGNGFFIEGIPMSGKKKVLIVTIAIILAVINHLLPIFNTILDYQNRNIVTIGLIIVFLIFSIGSKTAETIVIGLSIIAIISNLWDFSVGDVSEVRRQILIYSFIILGIASIFGEISIIRIMKKQLGA